MLGRFAPERVWPGVLGPAQCLLFGALPTPLGAQDSVVVVPDAPACRTCSLNVSAVLELGDREGPGIVGEQAYINRSDDGDYYVSSSVQAGRLLRFSPDGVFREAIGRRGEGPGEYFLPMLMAGSADNLTILDIRSFRLTTIRGGEVATIKLPFMSEDEAVLPDGRHVYSAIVYEPDRIGHPLHVYDLERRRVTRSFGDEGVRVDRSDRSQTALTRLIAVAADGNIWAAHENRYRIDKWSPDGVRITRIERDAPWFRHWVDWPGSDYEVRPEPAIVGVRDWGDDLLMVVVRVADADWRPMRPARVERGHELITAAQYEELYDTVVEILDIRSGTVLARTQVDARVWRLVGRDGFYSYAEHSELGEPKHVVWSVALTGNSRLAAGAWYRPHNRGSWQGPCEDGIPKPGLPNRRGTKGKHAPCTPGEALAELDDAIVNGRADQLGAILADSEGVVLNPERRAIQVWSTCTDGKLGAHLPLPTDLFDALVLAQDQDARG